MSTPLVRRSPPHRARVLAARELTPRMRRITLQADSMIGVATRPAQDVELFLREDSGRRVKRRYTIRHARPVAGELDLDVLLHGHGPGSTWGATALPGDIVDFQGPRGKLELSAADWHLLVGDESAAPAIASVCEALSASGPGAEKAIAVIEISTASDAVPLPDSAQAHWVERGAAPPGSADLLAAAVGVLRLPPGHGHGYLMGETRAMVALRAVLQARGLAHEAIFVKGYWNLGRPDRIAGRSPSAP
ncbi:MAG: siderophore-interacting protein [Actinomycetota bacterium]|nr:siderophore-interacting protein [Actinomycetota bacterium]